MANYPLQFNRAFQNPPFATRSAAIDYIQNVKLINDPLVEGQPYVVSYGDPGDPSVILAIGTISGKCYLFDLEGMQGDIDGKVDVANAGVLIADVVVTSVTATNIVLTVTYRDTSDGTETSATITLNPANSINSGLMIADDKVKLDALPTNAELETRFTDIETDVADHETRIDALETAVGGAETDISDLQTALAQEILDRQSADTTLQGNIDQVQTNLDNEVTRATTAEADLQSQITGLGNNKIDKNGIQNTLFGVVDDTLFAIPRGTKDLWVNSHATQSSALTNGSQFFPFLTITDAVASVISGTSETIHLSSGCSFNEGVALTLNNLTNLSIVLEGADDQFRSEVTGNLIIGGTSTELGLKGFQVDGNLTLSSSVGDIYLTNIAIKGTTTISGNGYYYLKDCQFMNNTTITGACEVFIDAGSNEKNSVIAVNNPNAVVIIKDLTNVTLNLISGNVLVQGSTNFVISPNLPGGRCITAQAGLLDLMDGTAQQVDTTYAPIAIGASASYSLGKFIFEPTNSILNGTLIDGGLHSLQIYDHITRTGYSHVYDTLNSHLDGISNALNVHTTDITNLQTDVAQNTADIAALQGGVGFLPAYNFGNPNDTTLYPSPTIWQNTLNNYALSFGITLRNGLSVRNLWDSHRWTYSDTLTEWNDQGIDVVNTATNTLTGVVKGVDSGIGALGTISVDNNLGEMSVNGLSNALALKADLSYVNTQLALKADAFTVTDMNTTLQNQIDNQQIAITTLTTDLSNEINRATSAEQVLTNNLTAEATMRANADTQLQTNIDSVQTNLTNEITRATGVENGLQTAINGHESRITTLEGTSSTNTANITQLQTDLINEINTRSTQVTAINSDITTLQTQVGILNTQVDTLQTQVATLQDQVITSGAFDSASGHILLTTASGGIITVTLTGITNLGTF